MSLKLAYEDVHRENIEADNDHCFVREVVYVAEDDRESLVLG